MDTHVISGVANDVEKAWRCTSTLDGAISTAVGPEDAGCCVGRTGGAEDTARLISGTRSAKPQQFPPFCHDGTERRIQRPTDADEQKSHYSGKKKSHTVKNLVLVNQQLLIEFVSETTPGSVHDKRLADATAYPLPEGSHLLQDLGFLGFTLKGVMIEMPTKKPKGGELTLSQKEANHALSHRRIAIEHVNSSIKRCRILKDVCRLLLPGIRDCIMEISCALHNFRLRLDPWLPIP